MELLINKAKVAAILQVAIGFNDAEFEVFIREAQDFDLKPLLCEDFYFELVAKKEDEYWKKLIDGGDYEFEEKPFFFRGFADVLSYFTYARFIRKSNGVSTSHGFVNKTTPHSTPLDTAEKNNLYYKYKKDANIIFEDVKKFIERNIETYPSWNECGNSCETVKSGFKTRVIK